MRFTTVLSLSTVATATEFLWSAQQQPLAPYDSHYPVADIPALGFGTWNLSPDHENATKAVEAAIVAGYRHIDCAAAYSNEQAVGLGIARGLRAANLTRSDIWVTSKLWNTAHETTAVSEAAEETLRNLDVGYLDLYLMHWPVAQSSSSFGSKKAEISYLETWRAMSALLQGDAVRHIGVSNFSPAQMRDLLANGGGVRPYAHQMEMHPYLPQSEWLLWHASQGIHVTAYSPLGNMNPTYDGHEDPPEHLLENKVVQDIAEAAGCSPAQAVLSWGIARSASVIPKSKHVNRIKENFAAPECELKYEDFVALGKLGEEPFRFNNPSKGWGVKLYEGLQGA